MSHERTRGRSWVQAQDVIVGFDLPTAEYVHGSAKRSGLRVVLRLWQSRTDVKRAGSVAPGPCAPGS